MAMTAIAQNIVKFATRPLVYNGASSEEYRSGPMTCSKLGLEIPGSESNTYVAGA
jgi:hypothetical protein